MKIAGSKSRTFWEWVVLFGSMVGTIVAVRTAGVSPKWEAPSVYTVIIFAVVVTSLRPAWGRPNFWLTLTAAFLVHVLAIFFAIREFPVIRAGFHGLILLIPGIVEGLLITSFLWKASMKSHRRQVSFEK